MSVTLEQRARLYHEASADLSRRRAELYSAIRRAAKGGSSLAAIGRATGLSKARVQQVVGG